MSMGYGGVARLILQDESTAIYEYAPYNLNYLEFTNEQHTYDGLITISKDALVKPEIHEKIKRMPSGKKKLVKKLIHRRVDRSELIQSEKIIVENSCFCFRQHDNGCGVIAGRLLYKIFDQYQDNGILPKIVSVHA